MPTRIDWMRGLEGKSGEDGDRMNGDRTEDRLEDQNEKREGWEGRGERREERIGREEQKTEEEERRDEEEEERRRGKRGMRGREGKRRKEEQNRRQIIRRVQYKIRYNI